MGAKKGRIGTLGSLGATGKVLETPRTPQGVKCGAETPQAQALLAQFGLDVARISPLKRLEAERRLQRYNLHHWLTTHSLVAVPRVELSNSRKAALKECFDMLDADSGGSINLSELSLAMKALGFSQSDIKEAMAMGDRNGDGELNFEEFCALIATAEAADPEGAGSNHGADSFPFALIANSYNISKLIDSYNPALKEHAAAKSAQTSPSSLPPISSRNNDRQQVPTNGSPPAPPRASPKADFRVQKVVHGNTGAALPPIKQREQSLDDVTSEPTVV
mmetsp:Transcript_33909/g.56033  ORF Transcript_33909/g.56033 Transcript_33909/m.56033 type:complete len:277 (+) Transcript_33909:56-886(+)|eukprot:CAMPEP_0119313710 /NCGR_PEP_ID=MMETSP1333-20130426/30086_1 /TAXON_ID=418940 /ORGANISM="Scyphosphaera apsteinii, Strain RCC1455" /LENGTH=276 /DNA_ID=CAMNT_0007318619 /DNA_START=50 /DNA_END=880 /DNA_ORIENTATION=-